MNKEHLIMSNLSVPLNCISEKIDKITNYACVSNVAYLVETSENLTFTSDFILLDDVNTSKRSKCAT